MSLHHTIVVQINWDNAECLAHQKCPRKATHFNYLHLFGVGIQEIPAVHHPCWTCHWHTPQWQILLTFFFFFLLFSTAPEAYGSSQARGRIRAVDFGLHHSRSKAMQDPSWICDLHHRSEQSRILNPLIKARDQTCILMDTNQIRFHWATTGTPN